MKDGNKFPIALSNVVKHKSVDFSGGVLGGFVRAEGKVLITPVDESTSKIDYSFELLGFLGSIVSAIKRKEVVGGTEGGLKNMVTMSEEAHKK